MAAVSARATTQASRDAAGWGVIAGIAAALAASWWELLFLPLGDSHDGRIMGRFGLHIRNFWESGLAGSGFLSDLSPFPNATYAHHPPLTNFAQVLISAVVGQGEWQLRLLGYSSGIVTVVALAWLLRTLGFGWPATVAATAATATTAMFWLYARLGPGFWLSVILVGAALQHRRGRASPRPLVLLAGLSALLSWEALAIAVLVALWLWRTPATRSTGRALAVAAGLGVVVTAIWMLAATDLSELMERTVERVTAEGLGPGAFLGQLGWFYSTLFPLWYLVLLVPAVVSILVDGGERRTVASIFLVVALAMTLGLPEAAFIHDYWTKLLLVPFTLGIASLLSRVPGEAMQWAAAGLTVVLFAAWMVGPDREWFERSYFEEASDAGRVLQMVDPPPEQATGYVAGAIALPRWMSWYWDRPVQTLEEETIGLVDADHLVLVRWDSVPAWMPDRTAVHTVADAGRYSLVAAGELR